MFQTTNQMFLHQNIPKRFTQMFSRQDALAYRRVKQNSPDTVATLEVLTVEVKACCAFEVVSYVCAVLDDHYSILQHKHSFIFFDEVSHKTWYWNL